MLYKAAFRFSPPQLWGYQYLHPYQSGSQPLSSITGDCHGPLWFQQPLV